MIIGQISALTNSRKAGSDICNGKLSINKTGCLTARKGTSALLSVRIIRVKTSVLFHALFCLARCRILESPLTHARERALLIPSDIQRQILNAAFRVSKTHYNFQSRILVSMPEWLDPLPLSKPRSGIFYVFALANVCVHGHAPSGKHYQSICHYSIRYLSHPGRDAQPPSQEMRKTQHCGNS